MEAETHFENDERKRMREIDENQTENFEPEQKRQKVGDVQELSNQNSQEPHIIEDNQQITVVEQTDPQEISDTANLQHEDVPPIVSLSEEDSKLISGWKQRIIQIEKRMDELQESFCNDLNGAVQDFLGLFTKNFEERKTSRFPFVNSILF